jgi:hypothetical protein
MQPKPSHRSHTPSHTAHMTPGFLAEFQRLSQLTADVLDSCDNATFSDLPVATRRRVTNVIAHMLNHVGHRTEAHSIVRKPYYQVLSDHIRV